MKDPGTKFFALIWKRWPGNSYYISASEAADEEKGKERP